MIGSMRLLEGQDLMKFQSPVNTCLTMELEIDLEVPTLLGKILFDIAYIYLDAFVISKVSCLGSISSTT